MNGNNRVATNGRTMVSQVSVVTPVYNAADYLVEAVESALMQPETGEVILIEDGSRDASLGMCEKLAREYGKVRLLQHSDGGNHGAGASRNVGITNARYDYIAFLDADDFFLPGRFAFSRKLLETNPEAEGVYEAVGVHFETASAKRAWERRGGKRLTTMTERLPPDKLFEHQAPIGSSGYAPTDGWIVKRSVFEKTGLFDKHLRLHQDTAMFVRFAGVCTMFPGRLRTPVAMRRLHDNNRITAPREAVDRYKDRVLMWATLWRWSRWNLSAGRHELLTRRFVTYGARPYRKASSHLAALVQSAYQVASLLASYPGLIEDRAFWKALRFLTAKYVLQGKLSSNPSS